MKTRLVRAYKTRGGAKVAAAMFAKANNSVWDEIPGNNCFWVWLEESTTAVYFFF